MSPRARFETAIIAWAFWLGAALVTVAVVAPRAFAVLPSRTMAGTMVGAVLPVVFLSGLVVAAAVVVLTGVQPGRRAPAVSALVAFLGCAVSQFVIDPRIARLRADIGVPVESLAADDARRVAFGALHGYSVGGLGVAILAATLSLAFVLHLARPAVGGRANPN